MKRYKNFIAWYKCLRLNHHPEKKGPAYNVGNSLLWAWSNSKSHPL